MCVAGRAVLKQPLRSHVLEWIQYGCWWELQLSCAVLLSKGIQSIGRHGLCTIHCIAPALALGPFNYLGKPAIGSFIVFVLPSHSRFTTTFYDGVLGESISCKWLATLFTLCICTEWGNCMLSTRSVQLSVHDVSYRWLVCMQRIVHLIIISGVRALNAAWILFHVSCRLCFPNFIAHIGDYFFLDEANTRFYCLMDHVKHFSLLTSLSFVRTKVKFQVFLNCLTLKKKFSHAFLFIAHWWIGLCFSPRLFSHY